MPRVEFPYGHKKEIERYQEEGRDQLQRLKATLSDQKTAIMLPPIPNCEYIDKFPEDEVLSQGNKNDRRHQQNYETEVVMYRVLEALEEEIITLHGLDYYHGQYTLFVGKHFSKKKKTKNCKLKAKDREGECDFLVIGRNYIVIIEVKDMWRIGSGPDSDEAKERRALTETFNKSFDQGLRTRKLLEKIIEHVGADESIRILQFSAYPNFEREFQEQFDLDEEKIAHIIFKDDLANFQGWWDQNVTNFHPVGVKSSSKEIMNDGIIQILLTLWCSDQNNTCHWDKFDLGKSILNVDSILREAEITFKRPKHENPGIIEAPSIFSDFLGIKNLTHKQFKIFSSDSNFQWINGSAGTGKTMLIFGKIIELFRTQADCKILLVRRKTSDNAMGKYKKIFNEMDIELREIETDWLFTSLKELSNSKVNPGLVIVSINLSKVEPEEKFHENLITTPEFGKFFMDDLKDYHIFIDDLHVQLVTTTVYAEGSGENDQSTFNKFWHTVKTGSLKTGKLFWIACDVVQSDILYSGLPTALGSLEMNTKFIKGNLPEDYSPLSANLRNTKDIADVISFIRSKRLSLNILYSIPKQIFQYWSHHCPLPKLEEGHFVHGPKVVVHWLLEENETLVYNIIQREVEKLCESGALQPQHIALLQGLCWGTDSKPPGALLKLLQETVDANFVNSEPGITMCDGVMSYSSEWPAVIVTYKIGMFINRETLREMLTRLYVMISRARVYCSVIIYPQKPSRDYYERIKTFTDELSHVARIVKHGPKV